MNIAAQYYQGGGFVNFYVWERVSGHHGHGGFYCEGYELRGLFPWHWDLL